ncbi:MAG: hypothetical protein QXG29_06395, partial [Sulfolobales archaeon]
GLYCGFYWGVVNIFLLMIQYWSVGVSSPGELVELNEGKVRLLVYDLSRFLRPDGVYEPAWSPVFYNPAAVFSRDFSVLVVSTLELRNATVLDALSGCGVRALRYCVEATGVVKCFANDIDERAYDLIAKNVSLNKLQGVVEALNDDANVVMYRLKKSGVKLDVIDVDPYGSPTPFLRAASWAVRSGGFLGVTATDLASLSGARPWAGSRRYWCHLILTDVPKLVALRVLVGYAARVASELDRFIEPVAYAIGSYFIRVFYRVGRGATAADAMLSKSVGYLKYCSVCGFREYTHWFDEVTCRVCGSRLDYVGPMWIDRLVSREHVLRAREALPNFSYMSSASKLSKLLEYQLFEAESGALVPYDVVQMARRLKVNAPRVEEVVECLKSLGYSATRYYGAPTAVGTNGPYSAFVDCLKKSSLS